MRSRKTKLKRNKRGTFSREIGYTDLAKKRQPRFDLGKDEKVAESRLSRLLELYDECQNVSGRPVWTDFGLYAARLIAKGILQIPYGPQWEVLDRIHDDANIADKCAEYVQMLRVQQAQYPSLHIVPSDEEMYRFGVGFNEQLETELVKEVANSLSSQGVITKGHEYPETFVTGTLHEAFAAYEAHIEKTGHRIDKETLKYSQRKRLKYVAVLRQQHPDRPLMSLCNFDAVAEMFSHWGNRPEYAPGKHYNHTSAHHRLKELQRFLKWLDRTSEFKWTIPRGIEQLRVKFVSRPEDETNGFLSKKVYTPEQLATIVRYGNEMDRLLLLTGVNCAFGAAELGRLSIKDIMLFHRHEFAERSNFATSSNDSFVRIVRWKSGMFGEWLLWSETADALHWGIQRAQRLGSEIVVCRDSGAMLYQEKNQNPAAGFNNRWCRLLKRVIKDNPEFPYYSFRTLRKTLPDTLRHKYSDDLASIALAHKTTYKPDSLLEAYGNKPFGRLHTAIRELREHFRPMLEA